MEVVTQGRFHCIITLKLVFTFSDMVATLRKKMNSVERDRLDASAKANEEVRKFFQVFFASMVGSYLSYVFYVDNFNA